MTHQGYVRRLGNAVAGGRWIARLDRIGMTGLRAPSRKNVLTDTTCRLQTKENLPKQVWG